MYLCFRKSFQLEIDGNLQVLKVQLFDFSLCKDTFYGYEVILT